MMPKFLIQFFKWLASCFTSEPKPLTDREFMKIILVLLQQAGPKTGLTITRVMIDRQLNLRIKSDLYIYAVLRSMVDIGWVYADSTFKQRSLNKHVIFAISDLGRVIPK